MTDTNTKKALNLWFYILLVTVPLGLILLKVKPLFIMGWSGFFLLIAIVLVVYRGSTNQEAKKYLGFAAIAFLVLVILYAKSGKSNQDPSDLKNQGQSVPIVYQSPAPQENPSQVKQTSWGYVVEFTGWEFEGVKVFTAEKDVEVTVRWIPGGKIDNPEGENITNPLGYDDYAKGWKESFRFGWRAGVKPHAVLTLIKESGDTLDSVREKDILFFNKQKQEKEIRLRMNPGEELILYYHDINDPEYFQRNGKNGSYMRFEVEIF